MSWLMRVADHRRGDSVARRLRARRHALFEDLLARLPRPTRILDVGGTVEYWRNMGPVEGAEITLLNPGAAWLEGAGELHVVQGDARSLDFKDNAFDVVFSNSTIEHVGTWNDQRAAASEMMRVARAYFVQTPSRYFPIEPHFHVPLWQFWPESLRVALHRRRKLGWMRPEPDPDRALANVREIRLLTASEMRTLFPGCTLYRERFLALTKSFVAYGGWGAGQDDGTRVLG